MADDLVNEARLDRTAISEITLHEDAGDREGRDAGPPEVHAVGATRLHVGQQADIGIAAVHGLADRRSHILA